MINVEARRCLEPNCNSITPKFNYPDETTGIYCAKHQKEGMRDLMHERCQDPGCESLSPVFNFPGQTKINYCSVHKLPGMVDVKNPRCQYQNCGIISPSFNVRGQTKGIYCLTHKTQEMIDVSHKMCKTHMCDIRASNRVYKGYCLRCFMYVFPDSVISRNYKVKEKHVTDFVKTEFPEEEAIFDKIIAGGCSKRRPDILIDKGTHVVVVECDENQHQSTTCENKRMAQIFKDVGVSVVFIRFNPDSYRDNEHRIPSCFSVNKSGIQVISSKKAWDSRLSMLKSVIQENLINIPEPEMTIINLFYDR
jgi:hypothetical protein